MQRSSLKGTLHLVDLAGSQRLNRSNATGDRLKETVAYQQVTQLAHGCLRVHLEQELSREGN
ncbi:unnamed protein product [Laminaria digitata]